MSDELSDEEKQLLAQHRAASKPKRKLTYTAPHGDGTVSWDLDDDDADEVYTKHKTKWASAGDSKGTDQSKGKGTAGPAFFGKK